ncbi:MAG: T9SS type A sorting domain-containing protein [Bacteroidota bacterium]
MKKIILSLLSALTLLNVSNAQLLTQSNFTCTIVPKVMSSGTSTRLPVVVRATLSNLAPNTVYRFYTNLALATDFGTTNSGAGNPLFPRTTSFIYTTGASLASANNYDSLTTDAGGNYTGWFAIVNTGNARFTAGNYVYPSIVLDSAGSKRGIANSRFVATDSIQVLTFNTVAGVNNGSGIRGNSSATDKNIVLLYDNTTGTGRPLATCFVENSGVTIASTVPFYTTNVQAVSGAWGTIIPNTLVNGVKRIEQRSFTTGAIVNANTSVNGNWGSTNTVNPLTGATALTIASTDAPLPVLWKSFSATPLASDNIQLNWSTASETNNSHFDIQRSVDGKNFETIGNIKGAGNSNKTVHYRFADNDAATTQTIYYRLKQVDFDGKANYSTIVSVMSKAGIESTLPNPFNSDLNISLNATTTASATVTIMDIIGKTHHTSTEQLQAGSSTIHINTSEMPDGIYFVRVSYNGETFTQKIVKK